MGGDRLRFWTITYYVMTCRELQEEISKLEEINGSLNQKLIAQIRIEQCKKLLEEKCLESQ